MGTKQPEKQVASLCPSLKKERTVEKNGGGAPEEKELWPRLQTRWLKGILTGQSSSSKAWCPKVKERQAFEKIIWPRTFWTSLACWQLALGIHYHGHPQFRNPWADFSHGNHVRAGGNYPPGDWLQSSQGEAAKVAQGSESLVTLPGRKTERSSRQTVGNAIQRIPFSEFTVAYSIQFWAARSILVPKNSLKFWGFEYTEHIPNRTQGIPENTKRWEAPPLQISKFCRWMGRLLVTGPGVDWPCQVELPCWSNKYLCVLTMWKILC